MKQDKDISDILLDEENTEPISLEDETGKTVVFEQIAVIPMEGKIYCILRPIEGLDIEKDEAIVFYVEVDEDKEYLKVETEEEKALSVFEAYYDMLEERIKGGTTDD